MFPRVDFSVMKFISHVKAICSFTNGKFGILSGLILVISLFSLLQLFSIGFLSHILDSTKVNVEKAHQSHQQEVLMDRARMELLIASDKLNRAGIYYMEDKETGSEGSWHSLLSEALQSLQHSQDDYHQLVRLSAQDTRPEFVALKASYQQLYQGLTEIGQGLEKITVSMFFLKSLFKVFRVILLKSITLICRQVKTTAQSWMLSYFLHSPQRSKPLLSP